jgi:ferric-dicitrate binding protein FerR (iron transport regulator)
MREHDPKDFNELAAAATDGTLTKDDALILLELCRQHPELRERFANQVDIDRLLEMALGDVSGVSFSTEVIERIRREDDREFVGPVIGKLEGISRRRKWSGRIGAAGLAAALALVAGLWMSSRNAPAYIHRDDAAKWSGEVFPGRLANGSRLKLEAGLAEIHFRNGAELILEGPADLEIRGPGAGWLYSGKVAVHVPERAIGFTLDSPGGRVIDLGTSFGVEVGSDGATETQVFEGKVKIKPKGAKADLILVKNETFAVKDGKPRKSEGATESTYVTGLPPRAAHRMEFVHWSMDNEGALNVATKRGGGKVDPISAQLRNFRIGRPMPAWIDGPFGKALSFDGEGQAMETFHMGPGGDAARTIAFWVRVPADFKTSQGYGILSWGSLPDTGRAWQISANPYSGHNEAGRLRVGFGNTFVSGVTDLRDGKWHHCAVVLYQDKKRPGRFPVLLYVDGKMEPSTKKAVNYVQTAAGEDARPIWIGRSLGHGQPDRDYSGTGFFRGDLDEVYVFEGSLNRRQIDELMRSNRPPGE